jgi:hypothetical protein
VNARAIALLAGLLAVACAGPREPALGEGVVVSRPGSADTMGPAERDRVEERLREVEVLLVREENERALAIVDDLLALRLPPDLLGRARGLRLDIRRRLYRDLPLRGRLLADRDLYEFGDDIELTIELENVSAGAVEIPQRAGPSRGYILLRIAREDVDVYGNVKETVEQGRIDLPGSAVIAPGDRRRAVRVVPTGERQHDGFTIFHVSGHVRPIAIDASGHEDFRSIPLPEVTVRVLPGNWEPLAEDPLGSIRRSLERRAPLHLLVAAELVPAGDRDAATEALVGALREGAGPMARAVLSALRRLTGESLPFEPAAWIAWWDGRRGPAGGS